MLFSCSLQLKSPPFLEESLLSISSHARWKSSYKHTKFVGLQKIKQASSSFCFLTMKYADLVNKDDDTGANDVM